VRRLLVTLGVVVWLAGAPGLAQAHDAYDGSQAHPLRVVAYLIYPIGVATEWVFTRPLHFLVSSPGLERTFGHVPHEDPFGDYKPFTSSADWE
jgi:hypothetical protein